MLTSKGKRLALLLFLYLILLSVSSSTQAWNSEGDLQDVFLLPALSPPALEDIPSHLDETQGRFLVTMAMMEEAQAFLPTLVQLQKSGRIQGFEMHADPVGMVVRGTTLEALENAPFPGNATIIPLTKGVIPPCTAHQFEARVRQMLALSRLQAALEALPHAQKAAETAPPTIVAYVPPDGGYTYLFGLTQPNTQVSMRIRHGTEIIVETQTMSDAEGHYYFVPTWRSCPLAEWEWVLRPGDVVEVTAQEHTAHTKIARVLAWIDPTTDRIEGVTEAHRRVNVTLEAHPRPSCAAVKKRKSTVSDDRGEFTLEFPDIDFDAQTYGDIFVLDDDGNATFIHTAAYSLVVDPQHRLIRGYLKPFTRYEVTVEGQGWPAPVETIIGKMTSGLGQYEVAVDALVTTPGSRITVQGGGIRLEWIVADIDARLNAKNNEMTGITTPGRWLQLGVSERTHGVISTACTEDQDCGVVFTDEEGRFNHVFSLDVKRGDWGWIRLFDAQGNYQYAFLNAPALAANVSMSALSGYWRHPILLPMLDVTLKASDGRVKERRTLSTSSDGSLYTWFSQSIQPGDSIVVSDGVDVEEMRVGTLHAQLDADRGFLQGDGDPGRVLGHLYDERGPAGRALFCATARHRGTFTLRFNGADIGPLDWANVWQEGPDGHYTSRDVRAFTVELSETDKSVWGATKSPGVAVEVTLLRQGRILDRQETTSLNFGGFWVHFDHVEIKPGDILHVRTGDGDSVDLLIPVLTMETDPAHNRVLGQAPANQPIHVRLNRRGASQARWGETSATGHYAIAFDGLYWREDCSEVNVGQSCIQPGIDYVYPNGHRLQLNGAPPPPVGPDAYEPDNTAETASHYVGKQSHTLDTPTDEDWVQFTVTSSQVGVDFIIETVDLGWNEDTILALYDSDGITLLRTDDDSGKGRASKLRWTADQAGTYYVKIAPKDAWFAAYCDATYALIIFPVPSSLHLPLTLNRFR